MTDSTLVASAGFNFADLLMQYPNDAYFCSDTLEPRKYLRSRLGLLKLAGLSQADLAASLSWRHSARLYQISAEKQADKSKYQITPEAALDLHIATKGFIDGRLLHPKLEQFAQALGVQRKVD